MYPGPEGVLNKVFDLNKHVISYRYLWVEVVSCKAPNPKPNVLDYWRGPRSYWQWRLSASTSAFEDRTTLNPKT